MNNPMSKIKCTASSFFNVLIWKLLFQWIFVFITFCVHNHGLLNQCLHNITENTYFLQLWAYVLLILCGINYRLFRMMNRLCGIKNRLWGMKYRLYMRNGVYCFLCQVYSIPHYLLGVQIMLNLVPIQDYRVFLTNCRICGMGYRSCGMRSRSCGMRYRLCGIKYTNPFLV